MTKPEDQPIKLGFKATGDNSCSFKFDTHGIGKIVYPGALVLPQAGEPPVKLDTGLKFYMYSTEPSISANGYYYLATPLVNGGLKIPAVQPGSPEIVCPIMNVVCVDPYNLQYEKDKPTLKLWLFPAPHAYGATIPEDQTVCNLTFSVGYDFVKKLNCVELT